MKVGPEFFPRKLVKEAGA